MSGHNNPYIAPKSPALPKPNGTARQLRLRFATFAIVAIITFVASVAGIVVAIGAAISWPLSYQNLEYALVQGVGWGTAGGLLAGCRALVASNPHRWRTWSWFIAAGLLWAAAISVCFFVYAAAAAAC
jgi:hypothetical protein